MSIGDSYIATQQIISSPEIKSPLPVHPGQVAILEEQSQINSLLSLDQTFCELSIERAEPTVSLSRPRSTSPNTISTPTPK